jgi:hypothetical protein
MKSLMSLWRVLAAEAASRCHTSTVRDVKTVADRVACEGDSFITITLPTFGKSLERALELGGFDDAAFPNFGRRGGYPEFLQGFLRQIFDPCGTLLDNPSVECIRAVRQLTLACGKIERPATKRREARAMRQFVETEVEIGSLDPISYEEFLPHYLKAATLLWADVFAYVENSYLDTHQILQDWEAKEPKCNTALVQTPQLEESLPTEDRWSSFQADPGRFTRGSSSPHGGGLVLAEPSEPQHLFSSEHSFSDCFYVARHAQTLVPRHGPGATADRLTGNRKFDVNEWPLRLERAFPYGDYALPSWRFYYQLDRVQFHEPGAERPVKVISVPKTPKTPRIIAVEPTGMQYCQQALAHGFIHALEHWSELTAGRGGKDSALGRFFIGFEKQEPNRLLARKGSLDGSLATLDLSEASDRVLNRHVELLFSRFPQLSEAVQATRSTKADVQGHGVVHLSKFASMGSALCFPVEAMVFTTIVFAAIALQRRVPLNRGLILSLRGKVRVYGDDIIVPVESVGPVIHALEAFGLKVNHDKSFWQGKFRESCGGDYYDGEWVTPVRVRKDLPQSLADVEQVVSLVALRNNLYWTGWWQSARQLDCWLDILLKGRWPVVAVTASALGRESVLPYQAEWVDPHLHTPQVRGAIVSSSPPVSMASGEGSLIKFLIKRGEQPSQDPKHLERQGRPKLRRIKLRGVRPY